MRTPRPRKTASIELNDGETFKMHCCECGLTHKVSVAVERNGKIGIAMRRDQKETEARRSKFVLKTIVWKRIARGML